MPDAKNLDISLSNEVTPGQANWALREKLGLPVPQFAQRMLDRRKGTGGLTAGPAVPGAGSTAAPSSGGASAGAPGSGFGSAFGGFGGFGGSQDAAAAADATTDDSEAATSVDHVEASGGFPGAATILYPSPQIGRGRGLLPGGSSHGPVTGGGTQGGSTRTPVTTVDDGDEHKYLVVGTGGESTNYTTGITMLPVCVLSAADKTARGITPSLRISLAEEVPQAFTGSQLTFNFKAAPCEGIAIVLAAEDRAQLFFGCGCATTCPKGTIVEGLPIKCSIAVPIPKTGCLVQAKTQESSCGTPFMPDRGPGQDPKGKVDDCSVIYVPPPIAFPGAGAAGAPLGVDLHITLGPGKNSPLSYAEYVLKVHLDVTRAAGGADFGFQDAYEYKATVSFLSGSPGEPFQDPVPDEECGCIPGAALTPPPKQRSAPTVPLKSFSFDPPASGGAIRQWSIYVLDAEEYFEESTLAVSCDVKDPCVQGAGPEPHVLSPLHLAAKYTWSVKTTAGTVKAAIPNSEGRGLNRVVLIVKSEQPAAPSSGGTPGSTPGTPVAGGAASSGAAQKIEVTLNVSTFAMPFTKEFEVGPSKERLVSVVWIDGASKDDGARALAKSELEKIGGGSSNILVRHVSPGDLGAIGPGAPFAAAATAVEELRERGPDQVLVIVGHSIGASVAAMAANHLSSLGLGVDELISIDRVFHDIGTPGQFLSRYAKASSVPGKPISTAIDRGNLLSSATSVVEITDVHPDPAAIPPGDSSEKIVNTGGGRRNTTGSRISPVMPTPPTSVTGPATKSNPSGSLWADHQAIILWPGIYQTCIVRWTKPAGLRHPLVPVNACRPAVFDGNLRNTLNQLLVKELEKSMFRPGFLDAERAIRKFQDPPPK